MTDSEFLSYCIGMTNTPRCGFVPEQIARLLSLAGRCEAAAKWVNAPNQVIDCDKGAIEKLVGEAREIEALSEPTP